MYEFNDKILNGNGLQGLTCGATSFWNLLGLRTCLQFGQPPCYHNKKCHVHLPSD